MRLLQSTINVRMPKEAAAQLSELAEKTGISRTDYIRMIMLNWLAKQK